MKSAKKILLLVLSLVLLVGIFAVATLAEETTGAATVVYPDGSKVEVAVGDTIIPKEFTTETRTENKQVVNDDETTEDVVETEIVEITITDRLYYGEGETLYADDETEGWIFTVEGADAALADLTVTEDMAGKKIIASGVNKVYSTIDITFPETATYYKWLTGDSEFTIGGTKYYNTVWAEAGTSGTKTQYVKNNDGTLGTKEITYDLTKRVAGTYKVFFYDEASLLSFFSTSASIEIGGVLLNYQDLRYGSGTKHEVKLWADHTDSSSKTFTWAVNGYDRPSATDRTNTGAAGDGKIASVYFDLNGHTMVNTSTSRTETRGIILLIYSSQAGAHYFKENATTAFYTNDDSKLILGSHTTGGDATYRDNLHVHAQQVNAYLNSGSGGYIYGGHYYLTTNTSGYFVETSGRLYGVKNASFYVKDGVAIFGDKSTRTGSSVVLGSVTVTSCKFYSDGTSAIMVGTKTDAAPKFQNCEFYGIAYTTDPETGDKTLTVDAATGTATLVSGNTLSDSVTYKTVTFLDGSSAWYYTTDEALATSFAEGHPFAKVDLIQASERAQDNNLSIISNPTQVFEFDAQMNATATLVGDAVKVYMRIEKASGNEYITDASAYQSKLRSILRNTTEAQTVTLYGDVTFDATYTYGKDANDLKIDLNGYQWTITSNASSCALDCSSDLYIYSSYPGAVIDVPDATAFFRTNDKTLDSVKNYGYIHIGEPDDTSTAYGQNLTVYCKQLNAEMYSHHTYIWGGTYIQKENSTASYFILFSRYSTSGQYHMKAMKNATFIITQAGTSPMYWNHASLTFTNCSFINTTGEYVPLMAPMTTSKMENDSAGGNPTFSGCSFYDVLAVKRASYTLNNGTAKTWVATYNSDCSFGFSGEIPSADMDVAEDTVLYFANAATVENKEICGETYAMNAKLYADVSGLLALDWGVAVDYWEIGSIPSRDAGTGEKLEGDVLYFNPVFDLASVAQIGQDGKVTAAGSASVAVVFNDAKAIALSYEETLTGISHYVFAEDCPDAAALGEKFYELFSNPAAAYYVTLYGDLLLASPMGFGTLSTGSQPQYGSFAKGAFTLDLNGHTFSVTEDIAGIDLSNGNQYPVYAHAILAIESGSKNLFTIKSSVPGAQIVNPSNKIFLGIGERDTGNIKIEGENITVTTKGTFIGSIEPEAANSVVVDGGTYIYTGTYTVFSAASKVSVSNATFVYTNAAGAIFATPNYSLDNTVATYENVTVYAAGRTQLYGFTHQNSFSIGSQPARSYTTTVTFNNCTLVNADPSMTLSQTTISFEGENVFSTDADLAVAYPTAPEGKVAACYFITYDGKAYKVIGYFADGFALVEWGFGLTENWLIGEEATHGSVIVDGVFGYTFGNVTVTTGENKSTMKLAAVKPGTMKMNLTLQSKIGMNLLLSEALAGATVTLNGETFVLSEMEAVDGYYVLATALAPNIADDAIEVTVSINGRVHTLTTGIGSYAKAVLAETEDAEIMKAQNLTYAMVEYVRAAAENASFLADVEAPATYTAQTLTGAASGNEGTLLSSIAFQLDGTIAIAIKGTADAEGKEVNLVLATGRSERANITDGIVIFEGLYVNEFFGDMTITVAGEDYTYNYSLANYLKGIGGESAAVQALYNYAYYADVYVDTLAN